MAIPGTVNDQITAGATFKIYCIYVPSGTSSLSVTLSNMQADLDLYMGYGSYSSVEGDNYDWASDKSGTAVESITISSPQAGNYYIQVQAYGPDGATSSFRLDTATGGGVMVTTTNTVSVTGCHPWAHAMSFPGTVNDQMTIDIWEEVYCIYVPSGTFSLTVTLSNLAADLDLFVGYGNFSTVHGGFYDWKSDNPHAESESITISNPQAGNYYIWVYGPNGLANTFRLQAA